MKKLSNGRYVCPGCGMSHSNAALALQCCAQPGDVIQLDPDANLFSDEAAAATMPAIMAPELLGRAAKHMHDRAATYDEPGGERSMGKAVKAFNAITGRELTEGEGWLLLQILKDVRLFAREGYHADSAEDCIAYAALKAEALGR